MFSSEKKKNQEFMAVSNMKDDKKSIDTAVCN